MVIMDKSKCFNSKERILEWKNMTNLASATFGARVLFATDEWFGWCGRLLLENDPIFNQEYTDFGKWMDGWETRRKRTAGHDWCIIRLGLPGHVNGIMVDTAFFTGNQAPRFSLQGAWLPHEPELLQQMTKAEEIERVGLAATEDDMALISRVGSEDWEEIVGMTALRPGYEDGRRHYFSVNSDKIRKYTHIRLNIFPDGGIARLKIHGSVERSWEGVPADSEVDLLAAENGGMEVTCSNKHYGEPKNMIKVFGCDWAVLRLGAVGKIMRLVVDTNHFKGNFPQSFSIDACLVPEAKSKDFMDGYGGADVPWQPLLRRQKASPSKEHVFTMKNNELEALGPVSHIKISIVPDGGIMRIRAFGHRHVD